MTGSEARRSYRILGVIHAVLFGGGIGWKAASAGHWKIGILAGIVVGGLTLMLFWHVAHQHYLYYDVDTDAGGPEGGA